MINLVLSIFFGVKNDRPVRVRKETWNEERARLIGYLTAPPTVSDDSLDHALDVLDGKDLSDPSRLVRIRKTK